MNDFFANIFENPLMGIRHPDFSGALFTNGDYLVLGLVLMGLSFVSLFVFYRIWDPNPVKRWKWILVLFINALLVFGIAYYLLSSGTMEIYLINDEILGGMSPSAFTRNISIHTGIYALIFSLVTSIPLKLISINNRKNPI